MKFLLVIFMLFQQPITISDDLIITNNGEKLESVKRSDFYIPWISKFALDVEKYLLFLDKLDKEIYQEPINATISNEGKIEVGKVGYKLHRQEFTRRFYSFFYNNGSVKIEIPKLTIHPKVDSELLSNIRVRQIGQYTTYFNKSNKERSHNISLATEAINNHVVFPGETFSFNHVVGKRTKEKGYLPAPVIVKGELSEGIGGGICQVSSTLYNAVDRAGLKILQRYSHSRSVPYVPSGRDATVSWYGPDFTFKNKHNQPILIRAKVIGGSMIVNIFSSDVININPREVPSAPEQLPKEVNKS